MTYSIVSVRIDEILNHTITKTQNTNLPLKMSEKHPTSPSKFQPVAKRPNSAQGKPMVTRGATAINPESTLRRFDTLVLTPIASFDGTKLPTNAEVLQRLFHIKDHEDTSMNTSTKSLIDRILPEIAYVYSKVPCEIQRKDSCKRIITKLYDKWRGYAKNNGNGLSQSTINAFKDELSSLCDLTTKETINKISVDRSRTEQQRQEDIKFIQDQKTTRQSKLSPTVDQSFMKRQERKNARSNALEKRLQKSTLVGKFNQLCSQIKGWNNSS